MRTQFLKLLFSSLLLMLSINIMGQNAFITKWDTRNAGVTNDNQIAIALDKKNNSYTYDYSIDWGDGSKNENVTDEIIHTYATPGIYSISITGGFPYMNMAISRSLNTDALKLLEIVQWGDIEWQSMYLSFADCENLILTATDAPDLSKVTTLSFMFSGCNLLNQPIAHWDTSTIKEMNYLFSGAINFNQDINSWDVSNVTRMSDMFKNAYAFNQPLDNWNVEKVEAMISMFSGARSFNMPIGNWKTNSLYAVSKMFSGAKVFNQPIGDWNMSKVDFLLQMFDGAQSFNQDISAWDVSNVIDMDNMFNAASAFNQDISSWNVSKVDGMQNMFRNAHAFNQDISGWNVQNVLDFENMFQYTKAFDQNLGNWDIRERIGLITSMENMFSNNNMSGVNYDATLIGWASKDAANIPRNITLGAQGRVYFDADAARTKLINDFDWTIIGDIKGVKIVFEDYDGTLLKNEVIKSGEAATAPNDPVRANYTFTGWDREFSAVTESIIVKAQYVLIGTESFTVNFVDWDGTVLKTETVLENTNATPPTVSARPFHTFTGWSASFNLIQENVTIEALYEINQFNISFFTHDFRRIEVKQVAYDTAVITPLPPERAGYRFVGWTLPASGNLANIDNIRSDEVFIATYALEGIATYEVSFLDWDMTLINMQLVNENDDALLPTAPERTAFDFNGWDKEATAITSDLTIIAQYKEATLGIDTDYVDSKTKIAVYPNPVSEFLTIANLPKNSSTPSWRLYDIAGQLIKTGTTTTVNLQGMDQGLYILNINNSVNIKVVKE